MLITLKTKKRKQIDKKEKTKSTLNTTNVHSLPTGLNPVGSSESVDNLKKKQKKRKSKIDAENATTSNQAVSVNAITVAPTPLNETSTSNLSIDLKTADVNQPLKNAVESAANKESQPSGSTKKATTSGSVAPAPSPLKVLKAGQPSSDANTSSLTTGNSVQKPTISLSKKARKINANQSPNALTLENAPIVSPSTSQDSNKNRMNQLANESTNNTSTKAKKPKKVRFFLDSPSAAEKITNNAPQSATTLDSSASTSGSYKPNSLLFSLLAKKPVINKQAATGTSKEIDKEQTASSKSPANTDSSNILKQSNIDRTTSLSTINTPNPSSSSSNAPKATPVKFQLAITPLNPKPPRPVAVGTLNNQQQGFSPNTVTSASSPTFKKVAGYFYYGCMY